MIRTLALATLVALLASCSKDTDTSSLSLATCNHIYLNFIDYNRTSYSHVGLDEGLGEIAYSYTNGRVTRVHAGYFFVPMGTNLSNLLVSSSGYDSIVYSASTVRVFSFPQIWSFAYRDQPEQPTRYTYDEAGRLASIARRSGEVSTFTYAADSIVETSSEGDVVGIYHLSAGNLVRYTRIFGYLNHVAFGREELLLSGYDTSPNPLKGKHYLLGAYIRAFSNNNFTTKIYSRYHCANGVCTLTSQSTVSLSLSYDGSGRPLLGSYR